MTEFSNKTYENTEALFGKLEAYVSEGKTIMTEHKSEMGTQF